MKKTMLAAAILLSSTATVANATTNYIAAGMYDFADSDFYVSGAYMMTDTLRVGATGFNFIEGYGVRATGDYFFSRDSDGGLFVRAGVSHYDFGSVRAGGQSFDLGDESGAILGAGSSVELNNSSADLFVSYDTAFDGYFSVGGRAAYNVTQSLSVDVGYNWNSNSIDNEFRIGLMYRF